MERNEEWALFFKWWFGLCCLLSFVFLFVGCGELSIAESPGQSLAFIIVGSAVVGFFISAMHKDQIREKRAQEYRDRERQRKQQDEEF